MKAILLIDFGSTYTKVTAVDLDKQSVLGTADSYTTIETDIGDGLANALSILEKQTGKLDFSERYACSSAAGGLKMVTSGLVPELTAEAAKQASLGAGAKVAHVFSFELTRWDLTKIAELKPDIILLTGGTDGGNKECILHNAEMLATLPPLCPVVIAGNRATADDCADLLAGWETHICDNVMPRFNELKIEPAQHEIRQIFLNRIIQAKGLSKASELINGIMMPTPAAMLEAMQLLAKGTENNEGLGELIGVDLGGATTDVYSLADGTPTTANTIMKGLREPFAKRTVEGDIGMRYSVLGIVEAAGIEKIAALSGLDPAKAEEMVRYLATHTDTLPTDEAWEKLDYALACAAVEAAVIRHAGVIEPVYTPLGIAYSQSGKDLRPVRRVLFTGGALIHAKNMPGIARHVLYSDEKSESLRPQDAKFFLDKRYILASMGLLGQHYPDAALAIMKRELIEITQ